VRLAGLTASGLVAALALMVWLGQQRLPPHALAPTSIESVRINAADGTLLREVLSREDGRCRWVGLSHISPHLIQATLASEDQRFFDHQGVDWLAMLRALGLNLQRGHVAFGGSTLTMQLVRLLQPRSRTVISKLREMALAHRLERQLTKPVILWQYLNRTPYGNGAFGIEAAARRYLNKPAAQLSVAEAALLSTLPRSPAGYNPFSHRRRLVRRQRYILALMLTQGRITADQYLRALSEPIAWDSASRPFRAPHITRRVLQLAQGSGEVITTTIDPELQKRVEAAVRRTVLRLRDHGVTNAAVLVVDNATSEVKAYVGSADFFDQQHAGQVDGTLARRQPGSTMKPFTYAMALEQGLTPATILADLPVHFATDRGDYHPRNYDDTFHGPVRLRVALASSFNVPAVRTTERVGVQRLLSRLRWDLGFRSLDRSPRYYGLGLTLGNGEVTLQELTAAYAALARGGLYAPLRLLRRSTAPTMRRVFDRRVAYLISHILSDPMARVPAFGRDTVLDVGFPAAVKTGTSKDFRDNWTVGYTPRTTVGVWVGNFAGHSMHGVSGISGAGPLWADVMIAAQAGHPSEFRPPPGLVRRVICPLSGELAGPRCEATTEEQFIDGSEPTALCGWHRDRLIDTRNGLLAGEGCPRTAVQSEPMTIYPSRYRSWAHARGLPAPPTLFSPLCPAAPQRARVQIRFPVNGDRYFVDPDLRRKDQRIPLEAQVEGSATHEVWWRIDGQVVSRARYPYTARWPIVVGQHSIVAELPSGARSQPVVVTVQ